MKKRIAVQVGFSADQVAYLEAVCADLRRALGGVTANTPEVSLAAAVRYVVEKARTRRREVDDLERAYRGDQP